MKIDKKIVMPSILVLVASVLVITLAYFGAEVIENGNNPTGVTTGSLDVSLSDSAVSVSNLKPIYAQYVDSMAYKKEFTITNAEDSLDSSNDIYLSISNISDELKSEYFKYKVVVGGAESGGNFSSAVNGERLQIYNDLAIKSNTSKTISLYIWIEYAEGIDQLDMLGTELSANLVLESTDKRIYTLYDKILADNNNGMSDENIDFAQISSSTNGKGLYYTSRTDVTEDLNGDGLGERVYYYRGAVTNNNVRFGGYCWRIVRTNEDGSVRLRYNGTYENGTCPVTGTNVRINDTTYNFYGSYNNEKYNEYIWEDGTGESLAKTTVDEWYTSSGLVNYANQIANVPYCADKSNPTKPTTGSYTSSTFYGAANRLVDYSGTSITAKSDAQPTYKCADIEDKHTVAGDSWGGNGKLSKPIGLLTADEVAFAGGQRFSNSTYYLYTGAYYWLISPFRWTGTVADSFNVYSAGYLDYDHVRNTNALVPAVSLKAGTMVNAEGTGTYTNPYVVGN